MEVKYGSVETKRILDEEGSSVTTHQNVREWNMVAPIRKRYELRKKISSQEDEFLEYTKFSDELRADPSKLDPSFRIDKGGKASGEYYYVVRCYTQLEY